MKIVLASTLILTITFAVLFYFLDSKEKEPLSLLVKAFVWGFLASVLELLVFRVAVLKFFFSDDFYEFTLLINDELEQINLSRLLFSAFIIGGVLKEGLKSYVFYRLVKKIDYEIDEPFDCIVYAVMLSLGFQFFENILFMQQESWFGLDKLHGFINTLKHLICGVIMGYGYFRFKWGNTTEKNYGIIVKFTSLQVMVHVLLKATFIWNTWLAYVVGGILLAFAIFYVLVILQSIKSINKFY